MLLEIYGVSGWNLSTDLVRTMALLLCSMQTWAVFSKANGIAAASRFSGIENGTVGGRQRNGKNGEHQKPKRPASGTEIYLKRWSK